jgi:hypothetical protein
MTAAQVGQVIPLASAVTLSTCANVGRAAASTTNTRSQIGFHRFIFQIPLLTFVLIKIKGEIFHR